MSRGLLPMSLPYDHVFDQGWRFGLKVRLVTPTPCGHDEEIATTIVHRRRHAQVPLDAAAAGLRLPAGQ
jgi:hypothetical protein